LLVFGTCRVHIYWVVNTFTITNMTWVNCNLLSQVHFSLRSAKYLSSFAVLHLLSFWCVEISLIIITPCVSVRVFTSIQEKTPFSGILGSEFCCTLLHYLMLHIYFFNVTFMHPILFPITIIERYTAALCVQGNKMFHSRAGM
jgi:hypothetical protein